MVVEWLKSLLTGREVTSTINNESQTRFLLKGTPQGGVWSPKLWNMAINHMIASANKRPIKCIGFADDMLVLVSGPDPNTLVSLAQATVNNLQRQANAVGLSYNNQKTEVVLFTRKRVNLDAVDKIIMGGKPLSFSTKARYLGILLDSKLTFNEHLKEKISKTKKCLFVLHSLAGKNWGLLPKTLRMAYISIARPKLTYGAHIWQHHIKSKEALKGFNSVQRLALVMLSHVHRSTPTAGLEVIWHLKPLDIFLEEIALRTFIRIQPKIKQITHHPNGHISILMKTLDSHKLTELVRLSDKITHKHLDRHYALRDFGNYKLDPPEEPDTIRVYTDGSLIRNKAGCGVHVDYHTDTFTGCEHLGRDASVFQAEILAIHRAADMLLDHSHRTIVFKSDSQSALRALTNKTIKSSLVKDCADSLNRLAANNTVRLQWVKAHIGIQIGRAHV